MAKKIKEIRKKIRGEQLIKPELKKKLDRLKIRKEKLIEKKLIEKTKKFDKIKTNQNREEIINLIKSGEKYRIIGEKFNITRQRVHQYAMSIGFSKHRYLKENKKFLYDKIKADINNGLKYKEIIKKYKITTSYLNYVFSIFEKEYIPLYTKELNDRNSVITNKFIKGNTATSITKDKDKELANPNKVSTVGRVYTINTKNGIKRYPKIGNRSAGGTFERKSIITAIINGHEKKGLTFQEIADRLNASGKKTITGKEYTMANVNQKYLYLTRKNK